MLKIGVICGGPSLERGISLNSARSILDHLPGQEIEVTPIYVDQDRHFYTLLPGQLYSNTPADFDFKLQKIAKKQEALSDLLQDFDLIFPVIHGAFGEDGEIQSLLEKMNIPFVGSDSISCRKMFHKSETLNILKRYGFPVFPFLLLSKDQSDKFERIEEFFAGHQLKRGIVKPESGGSSIGVSSVSAAKEAFEKCSSIFYENLDDQVLLEPFCTGVEFTVLVFENESGEPVALIPTEIGLSYEGHEFFDYRKKYLPTNSTFYHTPPRFENAIIQQIREEAQKIFKLFQVRDFVRMDGWLMPDSTLYFTDLNPISGMEQNSFLFRQASVLGLTHRQTLCHIVQSTCRRYKIPFPSSQGEGAAQKDAVYVLFGGDNAERQVSLMSGTNVWLKLLRSDRYNPIPYLYDRHKEIWELPYHITLNHTVEEIYSNCLTAEGMEKRIYEISRDIQQRLGIEKSFSSIPAKMSLEQFFCKAKENRAFVFIAMHGGEGEDGTLQKCLENENIIFNGSHSGASQVCMDKLMTGRLISEANDPDILSLPKRILSLDLTRSMNKEAYEKLWQEVCAELSSKRLIIKPRQDGCSAGVAPLEKAEDLERYCYFVHQNIPLIPKGTFADQNGPIEMPSNALEGYIFEPFIKTDLISINKNILEHTVREGWIELTVGVLEERGEYYSLNPSITVAQGAVLSLEEKFQGGTGVNITPPPEGILSISQTAKIKKLIEKAAKILKIQNYARIDIFFNHLSEKMVVIEANTLPALTPSTVIYHQGLAEHPPLTPRGFLEKIISAKRFA